MVIIGVDEAGRGALAGPVSVGAALVPQDFDWSLIPGVRDSKQLSAQKREVIFARAQQLKREGILDFKVALVSAAVIDKIGITRAVARGIERSLKRLGCVPADADVRLDGLLRAPQIYTTQQTIIRGDQTEPAISLASIVAKVTRDRYMVRSAKQYPVYAFEVHKGYGTKKHQEALRKAGLCVMHRQYFCKVVNN